MPQTSEYGGIVLHDVTMFGDGHPLDCALYKDAVVNNLNHHADEYGQQLVNAHLRTSNELSTDTPTVIETWYPITTFGPFLVTCQADGTPYPLFVRIGGFAAGAANQVRFRVVVIPAAYSGLLLSYLDVWDATPRANVIEASTSSMTTAVLTPSADLIEVSATIAEAARVAVPTSDDAAYAIPKTQTGHEMIVHVWGGTTNVASTPTLSLLELREYVGGP